MRWAAALALLALAAADVPENNIPAEFGLVEGIAWDPVSEQLFAGSVDQGALLVREGDRWRKAILPYTPAGILGMAVDARRRTLWLTSAVVGPTQRKDGFRGIIGVSTFGFEPVARIPMPANDSKGQPGDLTIGPDGSLYVSDGLAGGLFVCRPGCTVLTPLVPAGTFKSPQGLAVSRDGRSLYVADYAKGLWRVDLKKPKILAQVSAMQGIDGLLRDGDALIAIANGGGRKVLRLTLDATGAAIESEAVLATPAGPGDPTLGTIADRKLVYVADAQWDRFDANGKASGPARVTPIRVVSLPPGKRPPELRFKPGKGENRPDGL